MLPEDITQLRKRKNWSMSQLATSLGIHVNLVVDWESGQQFPTKTHDGALRKLLKETENPSSE